MSDLDNAVTTMNDAIKEIGLLRAALRLSEAREVYVSAKYGKLKAAAQRLIEEWKAGESPTHAAFEKLSDELEGRTANETEGRAD